DEAGMHVAVTLQNWCNDLAIAERAARQNLSLWPLSPSYLGKASHQGFILGFGGTTIAEIPNAVRKLRNLLAMNWSQNCQTGPIFWPSRSWLPGAEQLICARSALPVRYIIPWAPGS